MSAETSSIFSQTVEKLHLLKHPFYQAWMQGELSFSQLQDYAGQYAHHVQAFPRYVSAAHSNCEDSTLRQELFENLADEEGNGKDKTSHPELWARFAEGVGLSREELQKVGPRPAVQNLMETFFRLTRSSYHEALGALYAYESQVPEIAHSKIEGLKANYQVTDARTLEFFEVHKTADVFHREVVRKQLEALPQAQKQEALQAASQAAHALWNFLSDIQLKEDYLKENNAELSLH